ncbi:MAG: hypothetical protein GKR87_10785 [Kiritimatiellae bacterium]|nr:hypothetical protein [Kiritimatiellia bacterium]
MTNLIITSSSFYNEQLIGLIRATGARPPAPVTDLIATPGETDVTLDWDSFVDIDGDFSRFSIYRSTNTFSEITATGVVSIANRYNVSDTNYVDTVDCKIKCRKKWT